MKRMSNVLVAAAMILGTFGMMGCNKPMDITSQPETTPAPVVQSDAPAAAPQQSAPAAQPEAVSIVASTSARLPAPPALRVENPGPAPSAHHRWMRGYWRYDAPRTVYVWAPGFWIDETVAAPYAPPALRVEDPGCAPSAEYQYMSGYWRWSGREYVWVSGHWSMRGDARSYYQPRWENVNGHWQTRMGRDDARRGDDRRAVEQRSDDRRDDHRDDRRGDVERRDDSTHRTGAQPQVQQPQGQGQGRATRTATTHITVTRPLPLGTTTKRGHA